MKHFRGDILYLVGFAVVVVVGYAVAMRMASDEEMFAIDPTYRAGELGLPEYSVDLQTLPFAVRAVGSYTGPTFSRRRFVDEMESALAGVRRSLLTGSTAQSAGLGEQAASDRLANVSR